MNGPPPRRAPSRRRLPGVVPNDMPARSLLGPAHGVCGFCEADHRPVAVGRALVRARLIVVSVVELAQQEVEPIAHRSQFGAKLGNPTVWTCGGAGLAVKGQYVGGHVLRIHQ